MGEVVHRTLIFDRFILDMTRGCLYAGEQDVGLRPKTYSVLSYLAENAGRLVPKEELYEVIWPNVVVSDDSLVQCIRELRQRLGDTEHRLIKTVARRGYMLDTQISSSNAKSNQVSHPTENRAISDVEPLILHSHARRSIAVLPLVNLSNDPQQEYFSDGISEDIIVELFRISELLIVARNSSFQYKNMATDSRKIGRELGVDYILEGSIRCVDARVRISILLVDCNTGGHLWAERFDRDLTDIFGIQDEITRKIVSALAIKLTTGAQTARGYEITTNHEA